MANTVFKLRRSSVAGKVPNTSTLSIGELALNLTDRKLFSSDGSNVWETGSNLSVLTVSTNTSVNNISISGAVTANGANGVSGQFLTSNGSSVYWSTVSSNGGGGGTTYGVIPVFEQFTANGSTSSFTVTGGYQANQVSVFLNGVLLRSGVEVDVTSGIAVVLTDTPANGALIDVVGASTLYSGGINTIVNQQFTANGSSNSFNVSNGYLPSTVQVFLNGVKQIPGTDVDVTSGNNVVFTTTPANGFVIDVWGYQTTGIIAGEWTIGNTHLENNRIYIGNSSVNTVINSSSVSINGTDITTYVNNKTANAYTNAVSYTDTKIGTANSAITANASAAYTNAVSYVDGKLFVNTSQLSSNLSNYAQLAGATFTGDVTINANLIVSGTTVTVNTTTLDVKDKNITVAKGSASAAAANGAGLTVDGANADWIYNNVGNTWQSNVNISTANSIAQTNITPTSIFLGNSTVNCVINSTSVYVNGVDYNPTTALAIAVALS